MYIPKCISVDFIQSHCDLYQVDENRFVSYVMLESRGIGETIVGDCGGIWIFGRWLLSHRYLMMSSILSSVLAVSNVIVAVGNIIY